MNKTGLYIHIPFCVRKCPYCDFYSISLSENELYEKYADAVIRNVKRYIQQNNGIYFDTIYFGGGTPSLLPPRIYDKILSEIFKSGCRKETEITLELNPKTADIGKLSEFKKAGINRLSVGVQSAVDCELSALGRIHDFSSAEKIINQAYDIGFENISADLMIGIKDQTMETMLYSIDKLTSLPVRHLSAYMLKIEEGTEYSKNNMQSLVPDDDMTADMYLRMVDELDKRGFSQYEISNFSEKGFESRHNLKYWRCESYIGIGPSAHSFFNGLRYESPRDINKFISSDFQEEIVNEENPGDSFEKAMLGLRLTEGISVLDYPQNAEVLLKRASFLEKNNLVGIDSDRIFLTKEGFLISNSVISELLKDF